MEKLEINNPVESVETEKTRLEMIREAEERVTKDFFERIEAKGKVAVLGRDVERVSERK